MEFWSTGVLRPVGIAPRFREVGDAFPPSSHIPGTTADRQGDVGVAHPGLRPWAILLDHFVVKK
jgi:hypothetical protein